MILVADRCRDDIKSILQSTMESKFVMVKEYVFNDHGKEVLVTGIVIMGKDDSEIMVCPQLCEDRPRDLLIMTLLKDKYNIPVNSFSI
ncbi:hypothetical protein YerA41_062 [Yersinia phage YerA41]|uniref:Uncharacterized protein n=1 Tax=Yersinia phage vB_Yru_GN1 TaxID=3074381 RepID=A0AA86IYD4_9CAUD|nr:hypothetical protein YerA41_062 [Yersinia phage YerA41]BES79874.1 hypothetical protein [Yersinia phage vB_Yru_GN1]